MKYKDFTKLQGELDKKGIMTCINRIKKGKFEVEINYVLTKVFKTRISCKKMIVKIYNKEFNKNIIQ